MKAQGRVELVREMASARSCWSPGPRLGSGYLAVVGSHRMFRAALWPQEEGSGWPFRCWHPGPGVHSGTPHTPPAAAAGLTGAGYPASPGVRSGCTSAMQSLPDSSNKPALLADLPLHGLRGALSGPLGRFLSLAFHLTQTAGALQSSLQMAGKRWDPGGRDTGLWVAEGRVTAC